MDFGWPSGMVEALPELFGEEGHGGMEQAQGGFEGGGGVAPSGGAHLFQFEIPVAEFVPEELPELLGEFVVAVLLDGAVGGFGGGVEARDDPAVFDGGLSGRGSRLVRVQEEEAGGVPDLVGEGAGAFHALFGEDDIGAGRGALQERHADGVGAVLLGDDQRIDHVALGLGHLLAVGVADQAVDVDGLERDFAHEFAAQHHHAGDPEEEDVEAGDEQGGGVVAGQVGGLVGPAEGGEGPEAAGEPGVENVGVLLEVGGVAARAGGGRFARDDDFLAFAAVPGGDAVAPPELARDAPVADVVHPLVIGLGPVRRNEANFSALHDGDGLLGERLGLDEPLGGDERLDGGFAAIALAEGELVVLDFDEGADLFEVGDDGLAGDEAVERWRRGRRRRSSWRFRR